MKTPQNYLLFSAFLIILSLFAFKGKKEGPMILSADHRWKTEVSYDRSANLAGYVLHNDKSTELVLYNIDSHGLEDLLATTARIGNPVRRIVIEKNNSAASDLIFLKKKFPEAKILIAAE